MTIPIVRQGVVAVIRDRGRFLIIRRSQTVAAPGLLCFPGGGIEAGESESEALCRELHEELGIRDAKPLRRLWEHVTPYGIHLVWWLTSLPDVAAMQANPAEVAEILWMKGDEIRARPDGLISNTAFFNAWDLGEFHLEDELEA